MIRVLFVCLGNICRSPLAEGVFRDLVSRAGLDARVEADSAGTGGWHVGEPPDPRSQEVARRHGLDLSDQRGRRIEPEDFDGFDYVLAMDAQNLDHLRRLARPGQRARVARLLDDVPGVRLRDVPDPYYGDGDGFERVYDLITRGCEALLERIRRDHDL
jgi:protein-tyrosine phosphatase